MNHVKTIDTSHLSNVERVEYRLLKIILGMSLGIPVWFGVGVVMAAFG